MFCALLVIVCIAAGAGGCAHRAPEPDPYVANSGVAIRTWLTGLPRCPPAQSSDETPSFRRDDGTEAVAVRGHLMLSATPQCTATVCAVDCCNTCSLRWVVVADAGDGRELAIQKSGANQPLSAVIKECKLDPVRQEFPPPPVAVSGFLEADVIIRASLCVREEPAAVNVK